MRTTLYQRSKASKKALITLPLWLALLLSVVAGACFMLSLAPFGFWGVALISVMVLYVMLCTNISAKQAFLIGEAYGFGLWATGAFWLYTSIHQYGDISAPLALVMIGLMALIMGLFHAFLAWGFVRFLGRQPLAFASLWVVQEWLKTWLLTGFPWLFAGYAFTEVPIITTLAPVVGVLGISFVVVLLAASMVEVLRKKWGYLVISGVPLLGALALYITNPAWTTPTGKTLSVSLVQGNIPQDLKWLTEFQEKTLAIYATLSQNEWGRDVVIWAEGAIPMFQDDAWPFLSEAAHIAKAHNSAFVTGIPYKDLEAFDPITDEYPPFYNSVIALGQATGIYKKQNLVPFGEYIPMAGLLDILPNLAGNQAVASHSQGKKNQAPIDIKGQKMGVAICYEVAYPDTTRQNAKDSAFLLTVSNDAWFGTSAGPYQHLQMVQMRALETGRWIARGTNTGVTAIINDKGKIVAKAPQFEPAVLRGDVKMMIGTTPFMRFGSYPVLVLVVILIGLSALAKSRQRS
ncbi:MAG: apolipoprotein N-acyltransferase [Moraxella sp.]|nr:apolipoprotein N-acyltransferase [Moraxella sp.]